MIQRLDKWCDVYWIVFMCTTEVVVAITVAAMWDQLPLGAIAGIFSALIMPFHVLEEWKLPGGLHYFYNVFLDKSRRDLHRYPMSRLTDMITNIGLQWVPLVYAVLACRTGLSNAVSLCILILCCGQTFAHTGGGILTYFWYRDRGKKTIYHLGIATTYMMWVPAGVYILAHLENVTASDWFYTLILFFILIGLCIFAAEWPFRAWVLRQDEGVFAFEDHKYYEKYIDREAVK